MKFNINELALSIREAENELKSYQDELVRISTMAEELEKLLTFPKDEYEFELPDYNLARLRGTVEKEVKPTLRMINRQIEYIEVSTNKFVEILKYVVSEFESWKRSAKGSTES